MALFGITDRKGIPSLLLTARMTCDQTSRSWLMQRSDYTNNLHDMNTSSSGITCKNDKQNDDDYITIARDKVFLSASRRYSQDNCTSPEICNQNNFF